MSIRIAYLPVILITLPVFGFSQSKIDTLLVEGLYRGKNIRVDNRSKKGVCTERILVNGKIALFDRESASFEIQLRDMGFEYADSLHLLIIHVKGVVPK
ncbi:MAG: hypothetical protein JKY54_04510, partial [Flavobacteriales bacterium]|nr:hypothetical protein [Flavobacteriales bacterium]